MDNVQESSNFECYAPSSEPFDILLMLSARNPTCLVVSLRVAK
jgi:hypothetical protein